MSPTSHDSRPGSSRVSLGENSGLGSETLINHWQEVAGWPTDRQLWSFYLTLADQTDVHRVVEHYQRYLRSLSQLDMIAVPSLHITIQGIRFVDEANPDQIDHLANAMRLKLAELDLPILSTGRLETDTDALQLPVLPRDPLVRLRDDIQATIRSEIGDDYLYKLPEPKNGFNPHLSLAYANSEVSSAEIRAALGGAREMHATFRVGHLSLLKLRRETRRWSWQDERALQIGTPAMR